MKKILIGVVTVILVVGMIAAYPAIRAWKNSYDFALRKIDDSTLYTTKQEVEDTCRSMQASYESDKRIYEQYKDSENEEKLSWADAAKMRANRAAAVYNQYILKNSFVWSGNVPSDIRSELAYIE